MSFYTTLSGINAFTEQLSVISNNISNAETTAYKANNISFADVLANTTTTSSTASVGIGTAVQEIASNWDQGTIATTGTTTDMAISGSGFFVVRDGTGSTYYTRDGSFSFNEAGELVNGEGYEVQGYKLNTDGTLGTVGAITIPDSISATSTSEISLSANLNAATSTGDDFSASIVCYDSLGNEVPITVTFTKTANSNEWTWAASIDSATGTAAGSGTLTFDSTGALASGSDPTITLTLTNGATANQTITWNLYDDNGDTNGTLTQYSSTSTLTDTSQDGTASGQLESVTTDSSGFVSATYSNGVTEELYQIVLADFSDYSGLSNVGNNLYKETTASGTAVLGVAGSNQYGTLTSGALEQSNVDLATEMANMIIAQRAYESCAKMFTTESEILQTTVNMVK